MIGAAPDGTQLTIRRHTKKGRPYLGVTISDRLQQYQMLQRLRLICLGAGLWAAGYYFSPHLFPRHFYLNQALSLDVVIPCVPALVWVYLASLVFPFVPALLTPAALLNRAFLAYTLLVTCSSAFFAFLPTDGRLLRHGCPGDANCMLATVQKYDPAFNLFPSLHLGFATLAALCILRTHPRWALGVVLMAILEIATVCSIKQHYLADCLGGVLVASASYALAFWKTETASA
jgi:hypothetical protein